ncbi:hypothetical protein [uncultured Sphingomonas sp.]|uniref:hypothetical protein n=1 Tax=uncultured Sphingomonas sp. TaxID=158754 RepID=UPI0030D938BD
MRGSFPIRKGAAATVPSRLRRLQDCGSHRSADLAGRAVALSADIPAIFDAPLAAHHRLIGGWIASQDRSAKRYTRVAARRHIERTFDLAVRAILAPVDLVDLTVTVLSGAKERPPAIAIGCRDVGQLDLGWIETGDAPMPWRAAAYTTIERMLGRVLPVFGYQDLFDEIAMYYWDGEIDDEAARRALIDYHGVDEQELDGMALPSTMDARRPGWMIAANAEPLARLPGGLRRLLERLHLAHVALGSLLPERDAWHYDHEQACDYIPDLEECSHLPPLTLVPFEQFARELDDVARHGMETGFMDIAGLCPLPDAARIDDWLVSLRLGAAFLCAVQDLIRFDPAQS